MSNGLYARENGRSIMDGAIKAILASDSPVRYWHTRDDDGFVSLCFSWGSLIDDCDGSFYDGFLICDLEFYVGLGGSRPEIRIDSVELCDGCDCVKGATGYIYLGRD